MEDKCIYMAFEYAEHDLLVRCFNFLLSSRLNENQSNAVHCHLCSK